MVTNLCFGLTCLLIPVWIELFNLQAGLHLSNTGHTLVEVLILCGIYWLILQILRLDEWLYLRNFIQNKSNSGPVGRVQPVAPVERTQTWQPKAAAFHWPRLPFENVLKNHKVVKP